MTHKDYVLDKLKKYGREDIIITPHAQLQAAFRQIGLDEVKDNFNSPLGAYPWTKVRGFNSASPKRRVKGIENRSKLRGFKPCDFL